MANYYNDPRDLGNPMAQAGIAPPMYQRSPYATATVMAHPVMQAGDRGYYPPTGGAYPQYPYGAPYGPSVGFGVGMAPTWSVTPLTGYPSAYPHVLNGAVMAGEPFRMTQYFGPAYMPGFMDMMLMRMLGGMMGGGRGGGGGGSAKKAAPAQTPAPAMNIDWAQCAKGGCSGLKSGRLTGLGVLPYVDMPDGVDPNVDAGAAAPVAPVAPAASEPFVVPKSRTWVDPATGLPAEDPLTGGTYTVPIVPRPVPNVSPGLRERLSKQAAPYFSLPPLQQPTVPVVPAPDVPVPVVPAPAVPAPVVRPFSDTLS